MTASKHVGWNTVSDIHKSGQSSWEEISGFAIVTPNTQMDIYKHNNQIRKK